MAKGNLGNLLQHFVALHAAKRVVELAPNQAIAYVDLYAMAPWEAVSKSGVGFNGPVEGFEAKRKNGDFVADVFWRAWEAHDASDLTRPVRERPYPNTAVLLRTAFPETVFRMLLCEQDTELRAALEEWGAAQERCEIEVRGDWNETPLTQPNGAALVVLDPAQVSGKKRLGHISPDQIRGLLGKHKLGLAERAKSKASAPAIVTLFSYAEADPDATDRALRDALALFEWRITRVVAEEGKGEQTRKAHQAWWLTSRDEGLPTVDLQAAWNRWITPG